MKQDRLATDDEMEALKVDAGEFTCSVCGETKRFKAWPVGTRVWHEKTKKQGTITAVRVPTTCGDCK